MMLILALTLTLTAASGEELPAPRTARAMFTTGAPLASPGAVDLELGLSHTRGPALATQDSLPGKLYLGLLPALDVRLAWNGVSRIRTRDTDHAPGFTDAWLGPQLRLATQEEAGLLVACSWLRKVTCGAERLGSGLPDDTALLSLGRTQGPWSLDGNLVVTWTSRPGASRVAQPTTSLALSRRLTPTLSFTAEVRGSTATTLGPQAGAALGSLQWEAGRSLVLDAGCEVGLGPDAPFSLFAGLACGLGRIF